MLREQSFLGTILAFSFWFLACFGLAWCGIFFLEAAGWSGKVIGL